MPSDGASRAGGEKSAYAGEVVRGVGASDQQSLQGERVHDAEQHGADFDRRDEIDQASVRLDAIDELSRVRASAPAAITRVG